MNHHRHIWIDYAKGIAIMLVVYRHVFEGLKLSGIDMSLYAYLEYANIFFFSFRMPLFFIVSGLFVSASLRKKGLKGYVESRSKTILYPYFLWGFIQLTLQIFFSKYTNGHPTLSSYLHLFYLPREIAQFWYLYALFNVSCLYAFSLYILKISPIRNLAIGLLFFWVSGLCYREHIQIGFISDILHYYIFFSLGDLIHQYILDSKKVKLLGSRKFFYYLIFPFVICQSYFLSQNLSHNIPKYMYVEYYEPFSFLIISIVGCSFVISSSFILQKIGAAKWLQYLGRNSLQIYVAHVICFAAIRIMMNKLFHIENVPFLLISGIFAGLVFPLIINAIAQRFNLWWIFSLTDRNIHTSKNNSENKVSISVS